MKITLEIEDEVVAEAIAHGLGKREREIIRTREECQSEVDRARGEEQRTHVMLDIFMSKILGIAKLNPGVHTALRDALHESRRQAVVTTWRGPGPDTIETSAPPHFGIRG